MVESILILNKSYHIINLQNNQALSEVAGEARTRIERVAAALLEA